MFLNVLATVLATFIGFCLSTVFIKYNITEPKAHFKKYGYKSPALAQYHEKFTDIVNKYLNAFSEFDHKLYDAVHTVPREEEMVFLSKVKKYQNLLNSYKKKRKLHASDSIILHSTLNDLDRSYQALENTATAGAKVEAKDTDSTALDGTAPETAQYPTLEKTSDSQIITVFDSKGRACLWEYHPPQTESKEPV